MIKVVFLSSAERQWSVVFLVLECKRSTWIKLQQERYRADIKNIFIIKIIKQQPTLPKETVKLPQLEIFNNRLSKSQE